MLKSELQTQYEIITLESQSTGTITSLVKNIPSFVRGVKSFVSNLFSFDDSVSLFTKDTSLANALKKTNYMQVKDRMVPIPIGLKVSYDEYFTVLDKQVKGISFLPELLQAFKQWISLLLSDPKQLSSINVGVVVKTFKINDVTKLSAELSKCFDVTKGTTQTPFKNVFKRMADWDTLSTRLKEYDNFISDTVSKDVIISEIGEITTILDRLFDNIEKNKVEYNVSKQTVSAIADTAFQIAKECEFYSVFYYNVLVLIKAFEDTQKILKDEV